MNKIMMVRNILAELVIKEPIRKLTDDETDILIQAIMVLDRLSDEQYDC